MKHWKPIAAGSAIAGLALFSYAMMNRANGGGVNNDAPGAAPGKSVASRLSSPFRRQAIRVPAGTRIHVRLEEGISTKRNSSGDRFVASLDGPLTVEGKLLAPSHSRLVGRLTNVTESGRVKGRASLTMVLQTLRVDGQEYELDTAPLTLVARGTKKKDAAVIGGGAAAGAVIGAIAGGRKGAAIGAGVGGGSGTGYVLATRGAPVAYGPEAQFTFTLSSPLELPPYRQ